MTVRLRPAVGREVNSAFEEEGEEASPTGPRVVGECRAAERILTLYLLLRSGEVGIARHCPSRLVRTFA